MKIFEVLLVVMMLLISGGVIGAKLGYQMGKEEAQKERPCEQSQKAKTFLFYFVTI